ncbi:MAG: DNA-processing protein DprA [Gammaproteobacteria bacterium]|jgi:DNA processing protein|nr:DNA-processing protein DprA [Gammaproteobacteria bacterium]
MEGSGGRGRPTADLRDWLALARSPGAGGATLAGLLAGGLEPARLLAERGRLPGADLPPRLKAYLAAPDWAGVERDLTWAEQPGNHVITLADSAYPALLRETSGCPLLLFVHGNPDALALPQLAIVGSRNPTEGGRRTTHEFAAHLAAAGIVVTSGMALGIDAAAHEGALAAGGVTVAVTGTGLDRVYPARHRELAHRIAAAGALVSELPPGTPPMPANFPRRNRIVSGLALGTLVAEASLQSGSLITARLATEQGREVFAIPGSIHSPLSRGCHALIRQGAKLVETAQDIIDELPALLGHLASSQSAARGVSTDARGAAALEADHRHLLELMGYDPVTADELASRSGWSIAEVSSTLLLLELQGWVSSQPGGRYCRLTPSA